MNDEERRIHRALSSVSRVRLMRLLEDRPKEVADLAAQTGLHHNTVRAHLDVLVEAGLVERRKRSGGGPGRPRWSYRLAAVPAGAPAGAPGAASGGSPVELVAVLADALRRVADDPAVVAEESGRPWGQEAVAGERLPEPHEAVERVVRLLAEQGFDPELTRSGDGHAEVLLRQCPYDELAERYGDVVCSVHLGLIRGALEELGASVRTDLRPKVQQGLCITDLRFGER